ncbi:MAG: LptF/LptG family permease [Flammeovirgaceae bacterium]
MLKTIDKFIIKRFFGPFFLTFCIVLFIFLTHTFIRQFKHFVGKDLGWDVLGEMFMYFGLVLTPVSLPLAVLLASLMSFGSLGQHSELTAIKGAGISLTRILIPVGIFVFLITIGAFLFNDTISPIANLKAYSMLYDIKQKKPTLQFNEGEFYDGLPGYSIKVEEKRGKNKDELYGMMIYNHTAKKGNTDLIIAEHGRMYSYGNDNYLVLELLNGSRYTELSAERNRRHESEYVRNDFDSSRIVFSMESFGLKKTKEELFKNHNMMKTSRQLASERDSLWHMGAKLYNEFPGRVQGYHQYQYYQDNERRKAKQREETKNRVQQGQSQPAFETNRKNVPATERPKKEKIAVDKKTVSLSNPRKNSIIDELLVRKKNRNTAKKKEAENEALQGKLALARTKLKNRNQPREKIDPKTGQSVSEVKKAQMQKELDAVNETQQAKNRNGSETGKNAIIYKDNSKKAKSVREMRREQEVRPEQMKRVKEEKVTAVAKEEQLEKAELWEAKPDKRILNMAWSKANGIKGTVLDTKKRLERNERRLADYKIDLYMKWSQSVAVFIMFLIGAPLGAIIKKGGLGVPVLISIIFFVIFYISTIMGKKLAEEMVVSPLVGVWSGNLILFLIGLFCLRQAYHDVRLFDLDYYKVMIGKLFKKA